MNAKMFFITKLLFIAMITLYKTKKSLILLFDAYSSTIVKLSFDTFLYLCFIRKT